MRQERVPCDASCQRSCTCLARSCPRLRRRQQQLINGCTCRSKQGCAPEPEPSKLVPGGCRSGRHPLRLHQMSGAIKTERAPGCRRPWGGLAPKEANPSGSGPWGQAVFPAQHTSLSGATQATGEVAELFSLPACRFLAEHCWATFARRPHPRSGGDWAERAPGGNSLPPSKHVGATGLLEALWGVEGCASPQGSRPPPLCIALCLLGF